MLLKYYHFFVDEIKKRTKINIKKIKAEIYKEKSIIWKIVIPERKKLR